MCGKSSPAAFLFKIEATISEMWVYLGKKTKLGDEVGKTSRAGRHDLGEGHQEAAGEMVFCGNPRVGNWLDFHLVPYLGLYTIRPSGGRCLFQCGVRPSLRQMSSECMGCMHLSKFLILFSLFSFHG